VYPLQHYGIVQSIREIWIYAIWRSALGEFHRRIAAEVDLAPVAWLASKRREKSHTMQSNGDYNMRPIIPVK
jgi:hypothetical protein